VTSQLLKRFREVCACYRGRSCASDDAGESNFGEVEELSMRLGLLLVEHFGPARRVALLVPASRAWAIGFWGIALSGKLVVPLVEIHPARELARALGAARADVLLVARELGPLAEQALLEMPALLDLESAARRPSIVELEELLARAVVGRELPAVAGNEPAVLFFTSGTTGSPKGALVSHDQAAALARLVGEAWAMGPNDRLLHCLPLHHTHGLGIAFLVCLLAGASQHLLRRFEAERVWQAFEGTSVFMGVPTMHKRLLDAFEAREPSVRERWRAAAKRQRLITSGSAALPESLGLAWQRLIDELPLERFGMTEVGVALTNPLGGPRRLGSCGQVLGGMQVRIVDEDGADVPPGAPGEIWIRGPSVFLGYDSDPDATARAFSAGWFKSGDTATWLEDGFVKVLGRTSVDIIKSGGYKLSALEIEDALLRHASVDDVAVVGVPDAEWGEVVTAVIVGASADADELREFLKQELAPYKVPRRFVRLAELPKNALGKVTKHVLRAELEKGSGARAKP
jgi:malonyl-CoA/methylmalonyl-CoA synthetase